MKFPIRIIHAVSGDTFNDFTREELNELVRRANAFDEMLEFIRQRRYTSIAGADARAILAKYDVPSTEDKV